MRILMFNHFPLSGSGSGVYTLEMAKTLERLGHEVCIVYPENCSSSLPRLQSLSLRPIWFKNDINEQWCSEVSVNGEKSEVHALENGHEGLPFNFPCFTSHPRSHNTYKALSDEELRRYTSHLEEALRGAVADFKPDVLHIQHVWVGAGLAARMGIPYVITCHGTDQMGYKQDARYREMALQGVAGAHKLIVISNQVYEEALACYQSADGSQSKSVSNVENLKQKIIKIHNGYCPITFHTRPLEMPLWMALEKEKNPQIQWITFTGKLTEFKGVDILLKAAVLYEEMNPHLHTLISGDGVLMPVLQALAEDLGLKHIHFLGHQSPEALVAIYQQGTVHVVPSRTEPFGLVAVEALACGLPVIGTAAGGLLEIIKPEVGKLIPLEDSNALAQAVLEYAKKNLNRSMAEQCSVYAQNHFGWEQTARQVEALYFGAVTVLSPAERANTTA